MGEPRFKQGQVLISPDELRWEVWTVEGEGENQTYILAELENPLHNTERLSITEVTIAQLRTSPPVAPTETHLAVDSQSFKEDS